MSHPELGMTHVYQSADAQPPPYLDILRLDIGYSLILPVEHRRINAFIFQIIRYPNG